MWKVFNIYYHENIYKPYMTTKKMNKWTELLVGLILLVGGVYVWMVTLGNGFWDFGTAAWEFLKGGAIWFVMMIGLLFILLGISDLKG
jgi:hypothetical protein